MRHCPFPGFNSPAGRNRHGCRSRRSRVSYSLLYSTCACYRNIPWKKMLRYRMDRSRYHSGRAISSLFSVFSKKRSAIHVGSQFNASSLRISLFGADSWYRPLRSHHESGVPGLRAVLRKRRTVLLNGCFYRSYSGSFRLGSLLVSSECMDTDTVHRNLLKCSWLHTSGCGTEGLKSHLGIAYYEYGICFFHVVWLAYPGTDHDCKRTFGLRPHFYRNNPGPGSPSAK